MFSFRRAARPHRPVVALLLALLMVLTVALCPGAQAKETKAQLTARREIALNYGIYDKAMVTRDYDAIMSVLALDYEQYMPNGTRQDRVTFENNLRNLYAFSPVPVRITRYTTTESSTQWRGPDFIVFARVSMDVVVGSGKRAQKSTTRWLVRHYWSPTPTGWKLRQSAEASLEPA